MFKKIEEKVNRRWKEKLVRKSGLKFGRNGLERRRRRKDGLERLKNGGNANYFGHTVVLLYYNIYICPL